jgi:hypothetical protein
MFCRYGPRDKASWPNLGGLTPLSGSGTTLLLVLLLGECQVALYRMCNCSCWFQSHKLCEAAAQKLDIKTCEEFYGCEADNSATGKQHALNRLALAYLQTSSHMPFPSPSLLHMPLPLVSPATWHSVGM